MMTKKVRLCHIVGLDISANGWTVVSAMGVWILFSAIALVLQMQGIDALIGGFTMMMMHYIMEFLHQFGHSIAAQSVGYPMQGIVYFGLFGYSDYPDSEGDLAPAVHIRRALGGPLISAVWSVVFGVIALSIWGQTGASADLMRFVFGAMFIENTLIYAIGAIFPPIHLGNFNNDGATILYWRKRL